MKTKKKAWKQYVRICKKCDEPFNSETKYRKVCDKCTCSSHWRTNEKTL